MQRVFLKTYKLSKIKINDDENEKDLFGDLTDLLTSIKQTSAAIITKLYIF